jgi:hypothetical protein
VRSGDGASVGAPPSALSCPSLTLLPSTAIRRPIDRDPERRE